MTPSVTGQYFPEYAPPVPYEAFAKALALACHYQNRCCDLEEIVEMFCVDAAIAAAEKEVRRD